MSGIQLTGRCVCRSTLRGRKLGASPHATELPNIGALCTHLSADGQDGTLDLCGVLIQIQQKRSAIGEYVSAAAAVPCPVDFTAKQVAAHAAEEKAEAEYTKIKYTLFGQISCDTFGEVKNEEFDRAKVEIEKHSANWDKAAVKGPVPFFEGANSRYLA